MRTPVTALAAALGTLALLAGPVAAAPSPNPLRIWNVRRVEQGVGEVPTASGAQVGGRLFSFTRTGGLTFNLALPSPYWEHLPRDSAFGSLFSSATGQQYSVLAQAPSFNPFDARSPKGTVTHLDEYQAYEKQTDDATLRLTISGVLLQAIDANADAGAFECPAGVGCEPVRTVVRFHARAYAASAGGDFYAVGGVAYLRGHQHSWVPGAATTADSPGPLWGEAQFDVDGDRDDSGTGASAGMSLKRPIRLRIPLGAVRRGELFAVHVSLEAEAVDDLGRESGAQAAIQDPQHAAGLLTARGLARRGKPRFKEPPPAPAKPAVCPHGPLPHAGTLQLGAAAFTAVESDAAGLIVVTRRGGSRGAVSATVTVRGGTAEAGRDFTARTTTVRFADGETTPRLVEVPLREDGQAEAPESFTVGLGQPRCGALGSGRRATITIVDDDKTETPPPPPTFTLGGTVDGLRGTGLVLTDRGTDLAVVADGPFTLPGTHLAGESYDVQVRTQPHGPDQVCTVQHGSGTVAATVTDVAVHCEAPSVPSGLDGSFGSGGRVSTPVGSGHGEAVVVQPDGGIVTAGWRTAGSGNDFALTRHDATGALDASFGAGGIATTDLGGADDEAYDAASTPDGGIVAVGRTDAAGFTHVDFGVVHYGPGGAPDSGFGAGGVVRTDILGGGDQANAVAVQPDGKIVVAGFATRGGVDGDLAVVRYGADGTPDESFGTHGIVTTDLGTRNDDARAVVVQPDGDIVVAGTADEDLAVVRYTSTGALDAGFGSGGVTITDLGSEDVATGVALTPDGHVAIAGYTVGPHANRDFLLARYRSDGLPDTGFGDHGAVETDVLGGDDFAEGLVVDRAGRFVLVGRAASSTILDLALVRYDVDGTLDTTFDGDGIVTADFHGRGEFGQDVALDASGRIVAAGYTANGADTEFALLRANP